MGQEVYCYETNKDQLHVSAHIVQGGSVVSSANPLLTDPQPSSDFSAFSVTLADDADTALHADLDCKEFSMLNDSGSRILWGKNGSTSIVPLEDGDSNTLPFDNVNLVQARMESGAGAGAVIVVARF